MAGINKAILVGNLGQDPELRHTTNGNSVANFSMATNRKWNDKDGVAQERTEWHRVVSWGKTAENVAKYLSKGRQAYVEGELRTRSWEDNEGVKRYVTEIHVGVPGTAIQFLGSGSGNGRPDSQPGFKNAGEDEDLPLSIPDDDIPF